MIIVFHWVAYEPMTKQLPLTTPKSAEEMGKARFTGTGTAVGQG